MNNNGAAYARQIGERQRAGEIMRCRFEPMRFRLPDLAYYTPDFDVQLPDGTCREAPFCFEDREAENPRYCRAVRRVWLPDRLPPLKPGLGTRRLRHAGPWSTSCLRTGRWR